jgi:hypothetical protein
LNFLEHSKMFLKWAILFWEYAKQVTFIGLSVWFFKNE